MRVFDSGATRDVDFNKPDYEGFLSPLVIEAFGRYMAGHRVQTDGNLRDSDNWQKGIPKKVYIKSKHRHDLDLWKLHRGYHTDVNIEDACCAILFNTMGYLHEELKKSTRTQPEMVKLGEEDAIKEEVFGFPKAEYEPKPIVSDDSEPIVYELKPTNLLSTFLTKFKN